jgi:hypothetical protein
VSNDRSSANDKLDKAQEKLNNYRGKDSDKFDQLNDAVIAAEQDVSWWKRHGWA